MFAEYSNASLYFFARLTVNTSRETLQSGETTLPCGFQEMTTAATNMRDLCIDTRNGPEYSGTLQMGQGAPKHVNLQNMVSVSIG